MLCTKCRFSGVRAGKTNSSLDRSAQTSTGIASDLSGSLSASGSKGITVTFLDESGYPSADFEPELCISFASFLNMKTS